MKKITYFMLLLLSLFVITSCGTKKPALDDILESGKLIVVTNAEFPPFEYYEGDKMVGFDIELIKAFAAYLNVKIEIKDQDFDGALLAVSSGKAHVAIAGITVNEKRLESMSFSKGYFGASQVVIVKNNSDINGSTVEELHNILSTKAAKIGVQRGTVAEYYVEGDVDWDFPGINNTTCQAFDSGSLAVKALLNGQLDAVMIDEAPAQKLVELNAGLKIINVTLTEEEYAIAVKKGETSLVEKLNRFIDDFKESGEFAELLTKYFGNEK